MTGQSSPAPPRTRGGVFLCLFLVTVLLLAGCTVTGRNSSLVDDVVTCLSKLRERPAIVSGVFVEPNDGHEPVIEELVAAQCTIDLTIYMLTDETVFTALTDAAS